MDSTASDPQTDTPDAAAAPQPDLQAAPAVEDAPAREPAPEEAAPPIIAAVAPPAVTAGVGPTLRAAREAKGQTLPECAKLLRIRQTYLEALEQGRHQDLPGGTYATGFLRSYAEFLDLDGEEMVRRFREEGAGGFKNRTELSFPSPVSEGRIPGGAVIFLGLILAAVAYGGWYLLSSGESKVTEIVPPLPDRLAGMLNRPAALTGGVRPPAEEGKAVEEGVKAKDDVVPPQEAEEEKPVAAPAQDAAPAQPAPVQTAAVPEPPKAPEPPKVEPVKVEPPKAEPVKTEPPKAPEPPKTEPAKVEPPKTPEPPKVEASTPAGVPDGKVWGAEYADSRVVLKATGDDCWIQVREMDGSLLASRLLRKGDSLRVPNRPGLNLMVGNAGALEVSVDGRKVSPLGAAGQVRRDIRLDPDKLVTGG